MEQELRIIISGGGTGGHIFPAVAIAKAIKALKPQANILFVGAEGRMEMEKVPREGFDIVGLPVQGLDRRHLMRNIKVLWMLLKSERRVKQIIRHFRPQVVVGVGGYASGPTLRMAGKMGIPTLLQEQNSYAGVTNKWLAKQARKICVAYEGMERFFPKEKIVLTGNPIRENLTPNICTPDEAAQQFGLQPSKATVLVMGGSLGARSLNEAMKNALPQIKAATDVQFIWQTGKLYYDEMTQAVRQAASPSNLHVAPFITNMAGAYAAAQLVISRAGAGSISELAALGKPCILVPSPNVAEDHQTKNALALANRQAAIIVSDGQATQTLVNKALETVRNHNLLQQLKQNILQVAKPQAATEIAQMVIRLAEEKE